MDEMDIQGAKAVNFDRGLVIRQFVDLCFCFSPIVLLLPVLGQAFDIGQRSAIVPPGFIKLVRKVGSC